MNELYLINTKNYLVFLNSLKNNNDIYSNKFSNPTLQQNHLTSIEKRINREIALLTFGDNSLINEDPIFKEAINIKSKIFRIREEDGEVDIAALREIVDEILGIPERDQNSIELRKKYFETMIKTEFLQTKISELEKFIYDPGVVVRDILKINKGIDAVLLGCGKRSELYSGSCYYRFDQPCFNDHSNAIAIDLNSGSAPDVVTDMHDARFWQAIPERYLKRVVDHTNGFFIFENKNSIETLKLISSRLIKGGEFIFPLGFHEEHIKSLKEAGFTLIDNYTAKAL
jgi:hypothetical protein